MAVTTAGAETGAVRIAPPIAASARPMSRSTLKNLGVGLETLCSKFFSRLLFMSVFLGLIIVRCQGSAGPDPLVFAWPISTLFPYRGLLVP